MRLWSKSSSRGLPPLPTATPWNSSLTSQSILKHKKAPLLPMMTVREPDFSFKDLLLFHLHKYITNIPIDADASVCNLARTKCLAIIDTSIN
jgi:hypothetical protein